MRAGRLVGALVLALAVTTGAAAPAQAQPGLRAPTLRLLSSESGVGTLADGQYYYVQASFQARFARTATTYQLLSSFDGGAPTGEWAGAADRVVQIPFSVEGLSLEPHTLVFWAVACTDYSFTTCSAPSNRVTIEVPEQGRGGGPL